MALVPIHRDSLTPGYFISRLRRETSGRHLSGLRREEDPAILAPYPVAILDFVETLTQPLPKGEEKTFPGTDLITSHPQLNLIA